MEIFELDIREIERIRLLWQQLNQLHHEKSVYFKPHFAAFTFDRRMAEMTSRSQIKVFAAGENRGSDLRGYCLASVQNGMGEVDSLFVAEDCRHKDLGRQLMEQALAWLKTFNCTKIRISVAHGNEEALGFYEKLGFRPRFTVLEALS